LLATSRENDYSDLHENVISYVILWTRKLIRFWKSSAYGSGSRKFMKDSSTLWDGAFFPLFGLYLWKTWSNLHKNWYVFGQGTTTKVQKLSGSEIPKPRLQIRTRFVLAEVWTRRMVILLCSIYSCNDYHYKQ